MNATSCRWCGDDLVIHQLSPSGVCLCNSCTRDQFSQGPYVRPPGPSLWETLTQSGGGSIDLSKLSWGIP